MSFPSPFSKSTGFSLIEVLSAIAVLAVLASASFGVKSGLDHRALSLRTAGDLHIIHQALEAYRADYGDYPQTGSHPNLSHGSIEPVILLETAESKLFNALSGRLGPSLTPHRGVPRLALHSLTLLSRSVSTPDAAFVETPNALIDPWGRAYVYRYRAGASDLWDAPSFLLYSLGPDGLEQPPVRGVFDQAASENMDNVISTSQPSF